jgi:hypothetical protein
MFVRESRKHGRVGFVNDEFLGPTRRLIVCVSQSNTGPTNFDIGFLSNLNRHGLCFDLTYFNRGCWTTFRHGSHQSARESFEEIFLSR